MNRRSPHQTEPAEPRDELAEPEQPREAPTGSTVDRIIACVVLLVAAIPLVALVVSAEATVGEAAAWIAVVGILAATYAVFVKVMRKHYPAEPKTRTLAWWRKDYDDSPPAPPSAL